MRCWEDDLEGLIDKADPDVLDLIRVRRPDESVGRGVARSGRRARIGAASSAPPKSHRPGSWPAAVACPTTPARRSFATARKLHEFPIAARAWKAGEITTEHARVLTRAWNPERADASAMSKPSWSTSPGCIPPAIWPGS